jgi:CRP-like cAMP-binding protein
VNRPSLDLVRGVPLFAELETRDLDQLVREFRERRYETGRAIATEGSDGLLFFVIESGAATVTLRGEEIGRLGPGDAFGEVALVDMSARTATVTATAPIRCWTLTAWSFRSFARAHPDVAWKLLELLAARLRGTQPG